MDEKKKIIRNFKEIISEIKKHNKNYFGFDSPKISDHDYDLLKKNALKLEKNFPYLKKIGSVSNIVGSKPGNQFKKIEHLSPMLSLSNAFDYEDMKEFLKKINNFLNEKNKSIELFCEPKIDGRSATLIY